MLKDVLHSLYSGGWIANLVIGVALFLILSGVGAWINTPKSRLYGAAIGITILIWVVALTAGSSLSSEDKSKSDEDSSKVQTSDGSAPEPSESIPIGDRAVLDEKSKQAEQKQENVNAKTVIQSGRDTHYYAPADDKPKERRSGPIAYYMRAITSIVPQFENALEITITTTKQIDRVHFLIECDNEIGQAHDGLAIPPGAGSFTVMKTGVSRSALPSNRYEFSWATPTFTPGGPLQVTLWSHKKLSVSNITPLP